ncbi:MAG: methyltransferase domain-containing protein, partial [Bdellovibrionota bacterium]
WVYARYAAPALGPSLHRHAIEWVKANVTPEASILDLGCGAGHFALRLGEEVPGSHVTGADPSSQMIRRALGTRGDFRYVSVRFVLAPAEELPFSNGSFDAVVSLVSIKHWKDRKAGLAEASRVLRPGGKLYVAEIDPGRKGPELDSFLSRLPWPLRGGFTSTVQPQGVALSECRRLVEGAGFEGIQEGTYEDFPGFFVAGNKPKPPAPPAPPKAS